MQVIFGIGFLWGQRTDIADQGPQQFAILQDSMIEFSFEEKDLYSQLGFPLDSARGKGKVTGKAKFARVFGALYAELFFGTTIATGEYTVSQAELFTLSGAVYTVTNAAGFQSDLGVYYNSGSQQFLTFETSAPSVGQYNVGTSGVYTFNTGDSTKALAVSYMYTLTGTGFQFTITNTLMGFTPTFQATFFHNNPTLRSTGQLTLRLNTCISTRLSFPTRVDEYTFQDFDFSAISDGSNNIGILASSE